MRFLVGVKIADYEWFVNNAQFGQLETRVVVVKTRGRATSFSSKEALQIVETLLRRPTFRVHPDFGSSPLRDVLLHPVTI